MTSHQLLHITDEEAAWAALAARQSRRTPPILTLGVRPGRTLEDDLVRAAVALADSQTGGVCFVGSDPYFVRTYDCPAGVEAQVREILTRRLSPACPRFATYRRGDMVAVAIESVAVAGRLCIDAADGNAPRLYSAESGSVLDLFVDATATKIRAGIETVDYEPMLGFEGGSVIDPRAAARLGMDPSSFDGPGCLPHSFRIHGTGWISWGFRNQPPIFDLADRVRELILQGWSLEAAAAGPLFGRRLRPRPPPHQEAQHGTAQDRGHVRHHGCSTDS